MTGQTREAHPSDIPLFHPDGDQVILGGFRADPLVVVLVRYFGCLPCQHFLREMDKRRDDLPDGTQVVAVGGSSASQARWLRDSKGVRIPLLLDPAHRVRELAQLGSLSLRQLGSLRGWGNYGKALAAGFRPQVPTPDADKAPGVVIFDEHFGIEWVHAGEAMGDYPHIDDLIEKIKSR